MKSAVLSTPAPSSVETGGSNTRLNSQLAASGIAVLVDWLQFTGTVLATELSHCLEVLEAMTGEKLDLNPGKPTMCGRAWANSGRSSNGMRVGWDTEIDRDEIARCFISIPGGVLSALESREIWKIAQYLKVLGLRCSRIDFAVDDFEKRLKKDLIKKAILAKNYSKFRKHPISDSLDEKGGWTQYFGKRESARFTRLYDKEAESKGKIKSLRLETQFNAKTANVVVDRWLAICPEKLGDDWQIVSAKYIFQSVCGSIDFIDRASNPAEKNVSRLKRLTWWEKFCSLAEGVIYHTAPTPKQSLQKAMGWMKRQVFKSMKCVLEALGEEDSEKWLKHGLNNAGMGLSSWHKTRMVQFKAEWEGRHGGANDGVPGYA